MDLKGFFNLFWTCEKQKNMERVWNRNMIPWELEQCKGRAAHTIMKKTRCMVEEERCTENRCHETSKLDLNCVISKSQSEMPSNGQTFKLWRTNQSCKRVLFSRLKFRLLQLWSLTVHLTCTLTIIQLRSSNNLRAPMCESSNYSMVKLAKSQSLRTSFVQPISVWVPETMKGSSCEFLWH